MNNLALQQWQRLLAAKTAFEKLDETATAVLETAWRHRHGHFSDWLAAVNEMPDGQGGTIDLTCTAPLLDKNLSGDELQALQQGLQTLMPWRKGPFAPCGIDLDCEWRSDFKYERLKASGIDFSFVRYERV